MPAEPVHSRLATPASGPLFCRFAVPDLPPEVTVTPLLSLLLALECLFLLLGCVILGRRIRGAPARLLGRAPAGLTPSPYLLSELFLAAAFAFGGGMALQVGANLLSDRFFPKPANGGLGLYHLVLGTSFQLGLLAGLAHAWFWHLRPGKRLYATLPGPVQTDPAPPPEPPRLTVPAALREGVSTFLTALPIVSLTGFLWQKALGSLGVEAKPQDLVTLFAHTKDLAAIAIMIGLAVLVAPVTEELVFRVGLFRWLRTRIARGLALFAPAVVFASLHDGNVAVFLPLVVLAVCLSLAYERTGHPLVPMVAHALFNLNTLVLVLAGLPA